MSGQETRVDVRRVLNDPGQVLPRYRDEDGAYDRLSTWQAKALVAAGLIAPEGMAPTRWEPCTPAFLALVPNGACAVLPRRPDVAAGHAHLVTDWWVSDTGTQAPERVSPAPVWCPSCQQPTAVLAVRCDACGHDGAAL